MDRLEKIKSAISSQKPPPVHQWAPEFCGEIDIEIDHQGNWFHEGDPILRHDLVKLFSSILWFENGEYFLVTPAEKLQIRVSDVPFIIQRLEQVDDCWVATTNTNEDIVIGQENPVRLQQYGDATLPYINVRYDLWARPTRSIYYQWVSEAMDKIEASDSKSHIELQSADYRFQIGSLDGQ